MAKTKAQKEEAMQQLVQGMKGAKSVVFANFQGLTVKETEDLRGKCRQQKIGFLASKKSILKRALAELGFNVETKTFAGGIAVAFGNEDEVAPAQVVANFGKKHEAAVIFGGILEGKLIDSAKVKELAKLPSKKELYARLVGTINAPVSGFVNVLAGDVRGLLNVLNAIKGTKS